RRGRNLRAPRDRARFGRPLDRIRRDGPRPARRVCAPAVAVSNNTEVAVGGYWTELGRDSKNHIWKRLVAARVNSPFLLQMPISNVLLIIYAWAVWGPAPVNDASALISAFVVLTLAAAASVFFALRADTDLVVIVPLLSMLAVGLSRIAIGPEVTS